MRCQLFCCNGIFVTLYTDAVGCRDKAPFSSSARRTIHYDILNTLALTGTHALSVQSAGGPVSWTCILNCCTKPHLLADITSWIFHLHTTTFASSVQWILTRSQIRWTQLFWVVLWFWLWSTTSQRPRRATFPPALPDSNLVSNLHLLYSAVLWYHRSGLNSNATSRPHGSSAYRQPLPRTQPHAHPWQHLHLWSFGAVTSGSRGLRRHPRSCWGRQHWYASMPWPPTLYSSELDPQTSSVGPNCWFTNAMYWHDVLLYHPPGLIHNSANHALISSSLAYQSIEHSTCLVYPQPGHLQTTFKVHTLTGGLYPRWMTSSYITLQHISVSDHRIIMQAVYREQYGFHATCCCFGPRIWTRKAPTSLHMVPQIPRACRCFHALIWPQSYVLVSCV